MLPELLTAVGRAMAGERPVLVASHDVTENAWWIAAVSYLLGEHLAYRMTFTTYSHRPGYSRYHLTGILPDMLPPDAATSFQMFDFAAGRTPGQDVHPLAALLVSTGVMASPGLWQQAAAFASGDRERPGRLARARRRGGRTARHGRCPPAMPTRSPGGCLARPAGCRPAHRRRPGRRARPAGRDAHRRAADRTCSAWPGGWPARPGWSKPSACWPSQAAAHIMRGEPGHAGPVPERGRADRARPGRRDPGGGPAGDRTGDAELDGRLGGRAARGGTRTVRADAPRPGRPGARTRSHPHRLPGRPARSARTAGGRATGGGPGGAQRSARRPAHPRRSGRASRTDGTMAAPVRGPRQA